MTTTTKAAHTLGPWEVHIAESSRTGFDVQTTGGDTLISWGLKNEADANLIAAAPEMLDLLEAYLRGDYNDAAVGLVAAFDEAVHALVYRIHGDTGQGLDTPLSGEAAIQKARGGQ